jgi:hypothetical protein
MNDNPFQPLIGRELDTVSFVRDYVELRIDYSVIRSITDPTGSVDGVAWSFPQPGTADRLREYIGRTLLAAELEPDDHILLTFEGDATIEISLRQADRTGPEAAHFVPATDSGSLDVAGMWVW